MLQHFSIVWSQVHALLMFLMLSDFRFSKKKTTTVLLITTIPLILVNTYLSMVLSPDVMGKLLLLTISLPSAIVFGYLAKYRDGRFLFTMCMVDTLVLEIIYITQIINFYTTPDTNLVMFLTRLLAYPLLEIYFYKSLRTIYKDVQQYCTEGWNLFTVISILLYLLITMAVNNPGPITSRPESMPAVILLFILMPLVYFDIILTLRRQQKFHETTQQENILRLQVSNMSTRFEELAAADERFRMERHNYRHKMKTIASLLALKQYDELAMIVKEYNESYQRTQVVRYCSNAVIDAVLSAYIHNAKNKGIRVNVALSFPDPIPVNEAELATVFANTLENAIQACEKIDEEKRYIDIKVLDRPRFMIQIANSFDGNVEFGEDGIPVNHAHDHGIGSRSIAAFAKKYDAYCIFKADGERFTFYLNF